MIKIFKHLLIIAFLQVIVFYPIKSFAQKKQNKFTIHGYIRDLSSGEELIGATVYIKNLEKGTVTNSYGYYSISLQKGKYILLYSYMGYISKKIEVELKNDFHKNINLRSSAIQAEEVEIIAERTDVNIKSTDIGKIELQTATVKNIPALLGEVDILKTIQLLPGVQSAGEGNSGFYVRGGGSDQNLILLDEAVVYNTGHLFGFFSVFNADAIKNTTLIKGGMPANYGGRLSSVVDVAMKNGNDKSYHFDGGIGVISSRLTVEGPLLKNKSSFMLSGRRTYLDVLIKPFVKEKFKSNAYHFFDLNTKLSYRFSDKDRIFLSGYFGRDVFSFTSPNSAFVISIPWGNTTTTLRWNHLFNEKLFLNTSIIYNDYNFKFNMESDKLKMLMYSGIKDINYKMDFGYYPAIAHKIKFGLNYTYHTFTPSSSSASIGDDIEFNTEDIKKKYAHESAIYFLDQYDVSDRLKINAGLRFSTFTIVPPYSQLITDEDGNAIDTNYFTGEDENTSYFGLEPRINARFTINKKSSVKVSFMHTKQYIHLVSNANSTLPTDVWVPSTKMVKPQSGDQYSIGYFRNFFDNKVETSIELYYKKMNNQIEYKDGYIETMGRELEWDFVFGTGESYGMELFINKVFGKTTGWIGYTLSKTTRHFEDLITKDFPAKFDRTHDLSIVVSHKFTDRFSIGTTFIYGTGIATTLPINFYMIDNSIANDYMPRNSYRIEPYHRLDISARLKNKKEKKFSSEWIFSIYNVYNHKNVYFIYFTNEGILGEGDFSNKAYKVSLFPIIPSIAWNFNF